MCRVYSQDCCMSGVSQGTPTCPAMLLVGSATLGSLGFGGSGLLPVQAIHPGIGNC